jgi:hypothetical protein
MGGLSTSYARPFVLQGDYKIYKYHGLAAPRGVPKKLLPHDNI